MPKNEIFAKFAKELQADGMPLSVGVLYNNMHNQEFFDNLYGILQADGMQMDKQTFAKNLGLGTISSDYKTLGIDGKPNQVPTKTTPTTPKVTPITPQQPKPTAVVPNFNIPSVVKDIKTDERIVNSPIPSATSIETVPIKPSTLDVSKVEAKAKIQEQAFKGGYYPTAEEQPLIFEGKQYNENIAPIKREALPKYDKLFIDDILGDNANFTDKYNNTYLEKSDIEYQKKQSSQSGYNEFNYTKSNYDRQFNALKEYESKLNQSISNKFNTSDILTDIQKENESLNSELSKLEKLKSVNEPLLKSIESDITLLNNRYQNGQIDENAYRAEFAALKARHETINQEVNKKTSAIQEQQRQFQSKYSDKEVSDLLRVKQKQFEVAKEGANIINDPKFAKIKEGQANADEAQKIADSKKKLELQLQNKEIDLNQYGLELKKLGQNNYQSTNAQAFIADKTWNLVSQIATLPRTISGNFENNYGFVDKVADWANHMSEVKQKQTPYSSDIQVNTFQKFAQVGDLRVLLDDKGDAYDVRDNKYFSIDQAQAEQTLKQYNDNKKAYKVYNQTNADVFTKNALSTIADVGVLILGTKGLGALAGGGKLSSTLIGGGVAFTQVQNDLYKQGIESGLNPQDASRFATMVGTSISLISFINPTEYKLAGAGGLFPSIRQNALSQADVALINSGEMSVTQIAGKYAKGIAKNIVGENFEELIGEPLAQDLISNLYESRIANDGEGFTKQFDPISKQGLETLLLTSVVAIPFGAMEVNQEMPHYQAMAMQSAIENPQAYIDVLKKRKEMGIIDDAQMNAQLLQMQEISEVYNSVSSEIKDERKPELAGLLAKKNVALNKIKEIKDDVLSNNWKAKLEKINEDIQNIVDNKATKNNLVANDGIQLEDEKTETQQEEPIKVFSDFDNTLFDPTTQTLTPLGEEMKLRIEAGEDIEIVTARENTKENVDLIAEQLGIDASKITLGLTPEMKAEKVDEFEGKSQFIDDNTGNLQAVEGLGNDNVEVVPIVSKKETLFSKLSADLKANKEAKKLEKEQLVKPQEVPLNEKGEVDLPKMAADAIEVKTEVEKGSVGVGGDMVEPKKQNFTQFAKENGYPDDYDTSFQAQLLGGRGLEGKRQSNRSIKEQDDAFQEMQNKKAEGKKAYEQAILEGKVIDPDGKLTREGILKRDYNFNKKELESKIANAQSGIKNIEGLGKMAHLDNGKLKKGYQRAVDDYNETIEKHKQELDKLKNEYEQSQKETTKAETTPTTSNQSEIEAKKAEIERGRQEELKNSKIQIPRYFTFKELGGGKGKSGKALSSVESDKNEEIQKEFESKLEEGDKLIEPNGDIYYFKNGKVVKSNGQPRGMADIGAFINGVTIDRTDKINAKYDSKYVDAVKKGEMTKEQAMQALEEVGRKNSDAYAEIATSENNTNNQKADIERRRPTSYIRDSKDKKSPLETFRNEAKREWDGVSVITGDRMKNLYVGIQLFVEAYPEHKDLLDKFIKKENGTIGITNNNLSFVLNTLKKQGVTTESELGVKINAKYDAELAALEQSLKETTKAETQKTKAIITEIKSKNLTHVRGKGMGENQALGTFVSTEENNRYETPTQKAEKVDVEIENPLVVDDDYGLVGKRQEILNENRDKFTAEDSNDYQDLPNKKLTLDDLNDDGIKKLASLTTEALKAQGYDSIYFRESDTQEGELVVFDKKKVTFKENNIKLAENEKQQSEPGEKSINPISKDSVQKDTKKDETKTITKRKGTPKSRRQIRNPEYLKALSHEVLDVVDYVKQVIIGGATVQPIVIQRLFTTDRRNSNVGRDKSLAEKRSRIGILDKNGYPTISAFAHALWSNQVDKFGYEKFDTQQFENAIEEVISNFVGTRKLVDELNEMYDISDEKRYELERGSQGYSEYSDLVDETQYEQEDIDNAINMFENLSDEEIKRIESGSDAFLDRLVNDYLVAEYGEILNKEQNKPEEKKPSKNSPELISINKKIEEAEAEITKSNERLKDKIKELDKAITEDNADLFGNRKSEKVNLFEGSERVDLKQREKILEPFKNSVLKAKESLNKLKKKKQDIVDGKVESTGEIIFEEETKGEGDDRVLFSLSDDNQDPYTEVVNGFYSPLEKIINETKFDKLPAKQWIDKFAKGEEAKWTGLTDWLSQQQDSISKADIQQFLKDNRIQVVEVVKGSYSKEVDDLYKKLEAKNKGREFDAWDVKDQDEWMAKRGEPQETKFSQYQLEGEKENGSYKEILVTMPNKEINISEFVGKNSDYIIEAYKKSGKLVVEC